MTMSQDPQSTKNGRRNKLLAGAATVAVLAVVLFAAGSLSPIKLPPRTDNKAAVSTQFVQRAQEALKSGDTTLAAQLASQAVDAAPTSAAAKRIQTQVKAAIKEAEKSGGSSTDGKAPSDTTGNKGGAVASNDYWAADPGTFANAGGDLETLVPKSLPGYEFTGAWKADNEVQKTARALDGNSTVENLIWTVREMKGSDQAKSFITKTSKQLYKRDAQAVQVDGVNSYFGTDGKRYATCVYVRGLYVFELLATSRDVKPSEIKDDVVSAARKFSDANR